jgi:hypothetical protein
MKNKKDKRILSGFKEPKTIKPIRKGKQIFRKEL